MALFAATDTAMAWFIQKFVKGTFVERDPHVLWLIPIGAPVLFLLRGIGDYMAVYFPGYVGRQVIKAIRGDLFRHYLFLPANYYDRSTTATMLSRLTFNIEQDPRLADDHRTHRLAVSPELEAGGVRVDHRAAHVLADPQDHPLVPTLQRSHPGVDG
jgi:subfamily B ATP-binding cassette protein MsbA